ncbi:GSCOCG00008608001-RA-CDS [Cotesia congregata]|uniref:Similar to chmp7: Charged multivesicular body protein 7 (Xenopus laevis) n=1 Tax=Cotesia congregata TaxID=51543 RepID=A0A8J2H078_COTCN|nr:GSCOCG00008608001-RA-CDS [Cotesia congregata]CAG5075519.1 Similar to chmp7: Charged multivesicular body protein 7 (Xenopus laevis) [Cotesia congregata]
MISSNSNDVTPLPTQNMPDSWFKDEQMNAMFAEFRNRSVNPQDWDSKYKFWQELISKWLSFNNKCCFTIIDLKSTFKRKGCTPLCLNTVIEELYRNREIVTENEFLQDQKTWGSWLVDTVVKKPVVWSFSKLKNYFVTNVPVNSETRYVHLKTVKGLAETILSLSSDKKPIILTVQQITEKCRIAYNNNNLSEENVKLALIWIGRLKSSQLSNRNNNAWNSLLKISPDSISNLTESEEGLYKIQESEKVILKRIEELEIERNDVLAKVKSYINRGLKDVAKTFLRRKHELDKRIEKHAMTLQNLQTLITSISDAHSNTEVLDAYKKGSEILKNCEKAGLSEINARDTMDDVREIMEEFDEMQKSLTEPIKLNESDDELEKELDDLLHSDSPDKSLPPVPSSEIPELEKRLSDLRLPEFPSPPETKSFTSQEVKDFL